MDAQFLPNIPMMANSIGRCKYLQFRNLLVNLDNDREHEKVVHSPIKNLATNNCVNISSLSTVLAMAINPHDNIEITLIVYNVRLRPYLSST